MKKETHAAKKTGKGVSSGIVALFSGLFAAGFIIPSLAYAAPKTFKELANTLIGFINPLAGLLISLAVLFFFFSVVRYIWGAGSEEKGKYRENLTWSLVAIFVLVSVWGLARVVSSVFLGTSGAPQQQQKLPEDGTVQKI